MSPIVLAPIIGLVTKVLDDLFTSKEEKLSKEIILERISQKPYTLQAEINKIEASHRSIYVAGWRPFIGWICGLAMAYNFLFVPIAKGVISGGDFPEIDINFFVPLLAALLGIGGLRTYEKINGKTK